MDNLSFSSAQAEVGGLWNRPGGKVKVLLGLALLGIAAYYVAPAVTEALNNSAELFWGLTKATVAMAGLAATGLFLFACVTSKKLRFAVTGLWDILMNNTIGLVANWDPEALVLAGVQEKYDDVKKMEADVDDVTTKEEEIKQDLDTNTRKIHELDTATENLKRLTPADLARRQLVPDDVAFTISNNTREREVLVDWNNQLTPTYNDIVNARINLNQLAKYAKYQAIGNDKMAHLEILKWKSLNKANSAAQRFFKILSGQGEKAYMADQALLVMRNNMAKDTAQFKQVLRRSKDFTTSINLKEASYDKSASEYLTSFKAQYETDNKGSLPDALTASPSMRIQQPIALPVTSKSNLFE
jgi:hypothetical protein